MQNKKMFRWSLVAFILFAVGAWFYPNSQAQAAALRVGDFGIEVRGYPAGIVPGLRVSFPIHKQQELFVAAGYNLTDRRDFGENDNEEGGGPGGGAGYRYYLRDNRNHFFFGGRLDIWRLEIDWRNGAQSGETDITVLQPTAEAGYMWLIHPQWNLSIAGAFGFEINVDTDGRDVGEGPIGLLGLVFSRRVN